MSWLVASITGRHLWRLFAIAGVLATVLYALDISSVISVGCSAVVGVGGVWACLAGPRRWRAEPRGGWRLMGAGALCFLLSILIRPLVDGHGPALHLLPHAAALSGYVLLFVLLVRLLRARQSLERHAVLDALTVCLALGLASVLLLALPALDIPGRPPVEAVITALYPPLDVIVLLLTVNVTFTATRLPVSLVAWITGATMMFVGDAAAAITALSGRTSASPLLDVPALLTFTMLAVCALHPSVAELSRADRRPAQAWSRTRIMVLAPALATPFVLLATIGGRSTGTRLLITIGGVLTVVMLLLRAVSAVQVGAAAQLSSEYQARHDVLTGLPNRQRMSKEITRLLDDIPPGDEGRRVWVFLLDLDGFKWVNDSWGHDTGDQMVIEVAGRLRAALPASVPVGRVGGDEFLLVYVGDKNGALSLADEIRGCFDRPVLVRDTDVAISASIGIAHAAVGHEQAAMTADALMRDADTAMYRAKGEGPGRVTFFDTSMHDQVRERTELEAALRQALGAGQMYVAYQPIVGTESGQPVGAEALVRWVHPERGQVPPSVFIPIAEEAGLIGVIGTWVRQEALRQLSEWRQDGTVGADFYLSINVSPRQLTDPELPLIVAGELGRFGVPAHCVALEMTESVMVDGSRVTGQVLSELRKLGLKLLIDDFGTGFSALGYLRRFPVTGVKIDRSFVTGLGSSTEDEEIVRAVVAMSHALGLSVIAEGVETPLQQGALAAMGVPNGQGWLWGPAVPAAEFAAHWHAGGRAALAAATTTTSQPSPGRAAELLRGARRNA
ncbi:putative bifunctional diguanylate cyclase/phosphodiesterase [Couchioplanes caeruleus]|uniref:Diguanylate cyclase n=2 Tax=Couchioplanes caeruleus TaxID=56438 RepID=A0A1K0G5U2_9ACTN|nr:bifunctional diguanylate cyclase/phosphodiesterase [Couchioplanes caeruleus]OJF12634.1 diguanylate cyclase [Couchioplanes caeruleus subsp. caeruleus]ROP28423.1 diguanylate cyclase (GGDEF)-like protein [Couchioplanes caeruleus]